MTYRILETSNEVYQHPQSQQTSQNRVWSLHSAVTIAQVGMTKREGYKWTLEKLLDYQGQLLNCKKAGVDYRVLFGENTQLKANLEKEIQLVAKKIEEVQRSLAALPHQGFCCVIL